MNYELLPQYLLQHLDVVWTFMLLILRYSGLILLLPGFNPGMMHGLQYRLPVIFILACSSLSTSVYAAVPESWGLFIAQASGEFMFGILLGLFPLMVVAGAQAAGLLSATTMGLGAGQLIDPTSGMQTVSISRILGDLVIIMLLFSGVHHYLIHAAAGLGGTIVPGTFSLSQATIRLLVNQSGEIFTAGVMISAPVVVALLLTQFVMGLITKAVPTVNVFIVSFPLTIGIGLILTSLSLPDAMRFVDHQIREIEGSVSVVVSDVERRGP